MSSYREVRKMAEAYGLRLRPEVICLSPGSIVKLALLIGRVVRYLDPESYPGHPGERMAYIHAVIQAAWEEKKGGKP